VDLTLLVVATSASSSSTAITAVATAREWGVAGIDTWGGKEKEPVADRPDALNLPFFRWALRTLWGAFTSACPGDGSPDDECALQD
jgi:hypothetical protein